jgi:hypothetical protein
MKYGNIILCILIVILVYCFYLNIINKKNNIIQDDDNIDHTNQNIEKFANQFKINDLVKSSDKIETLINSKDNNIFNVRIWDNESYMMGLYKKTPKTLDECLYNPNANPLNTCPLSIWRPTPNEGFESLGDVMSRSLKQPSTEVIEDVRKPKTPGSVTEKNLSTIVASGINLVEPEDYIYIGGFGNDKMTDLIKRNELFNKYSNKIAFYVNELKKELDVKLTELRNKTNLVLNAEIKKFVTYMNQLKLAGSVYPGTFETNTNINKIINDKDNPNVIPNFLTVNDYTVSSDAKRGKVLYSIKDNQISVSNPFILKSIISTFPDALKKILFKNYDYENEKNTFDFTNYNFTISQIDNVSRDKLKGLFGDDLNVNVGGFNNHSILRAPINTSMDVDYFFKEEYRDQSFKGGIRGIFRSGSIKGELRTRNKRVLRTIGSTAKEDSLFLCFHEPGEDFDNHNSQLVMLNNIVIKIHQDVIKDLNNKFMSDETLNSKYNTVVRLIVDFKKAFPQFNKKDYYTLSIWQPIPPPGYTALGFVFTNDDQSVKPGKQLIKCVPQSCAKNFKRRPWQREDIIFKYTDERQQLVFYRNPFLNTIVVIDEKRQNGIYLNKTPSSLKYRNEKDSHSWECYDIIPCIKECTYVDQLKNADSNAKQMCKAYRGIENQMFDKTEVNHNLQQEEDKLNNMLKDKKKYITDLLDKVNTLMSEDELYKLITEGINRYKARKDIEERRQLHGAVADKLMKTRGFEISWDAPEELMKFKDTLKNFVVSQYGKVAQEERDCPVCKLPDTTGYVKMKDLELCYGCLEDVVRELIGKKKSAGEPIPPELQELQNKI